MDNIVLLVPPYLQKLGYLENPSLIKLAKKCFREEDFHPYWVEWRAMLEYICCLELAYSNVQNLPNGQLLMTEDYNTEGRYHTASIVFFSKAILDNLAMFLDDKYKMNIKNGGKALNKPIFKKKILEKNKGIHEVLLLNSLFLDELTEYRNNWIHRLVGGAVVGGSSKFRENGTFEDAELLIPMDPTFNMSSFDNNKVIEKMKKKNEGKYLVTAKEFTNEILDNTKKVFFEVMDNSLDLFD